MAPALPVVPGNGVGGVVAAIGAGVDAALLGRRVVTSTGGSGAYAEKVAIAAGQLVDVPDGVAMDVAVALLADGRTAMALVRSAAVAPGESVLVEAAAGGVGSLLVQLATGSGARVIAAAGGEAKQRVGRELGAARSVDYLDNDWAAEVADAAPGGVDVAFDGVGGDIGSRALDLVRDGGRFVPFGMASGAFTPIDDVAVAARHLHVVRLPALRPDESRSLTAAALAAADAGGLRPLIGQRFPLEDAAQAHAAIESRATIGKTLLIVQ